MQGMEWCTIQLLDWVVVVVAAVAVAAAMDDGLLCAESLCFCFATKSSGGEKALFT